MKSKLHFFFIIFLSLKTISINAQQGKLDTAFNTYDNGLNGDGFNNAVRTLSIQIDGNLIVGGDFLSFMENLFRI